jgi:hypothetical protein
MRVVFLALGFSAGIVAAPFADGAREKIEGILPAMTPTVVAMPICAPVAVNIYFERGQAHLSAAAASTLDAMSERVRGCAIDSVAIENQPATVASEEGRRIAGLRGAGVLKMLSTRGLAPESIVIAESTTDEPAGAATPDHVRIFIMPASGATAADRKTVPAPARANNEI